MVRITIVTAIILLRSKWVLRGLRVVGLELDTELLNINQGIRTHAYAENVAIICCENFMGDFETILLTLCYSEMTL